MSKMPDNHLHALILGIDPGLSLKKPMAMALVDFREDGTRHLVSWFGNRIGEYYIECRISVWLELLELTLQIAHAKLNQPVDWSPSRMCEPGERAGRTCSA